MPLEEWNRLDAVKFIIQNEDPATLIFIRLHFNFCGGCWAGQPIFLDLMARNERLARWMQIDCNLTPGTTAYFNVKKLPTFIAIKNKLEVGRYIGTKRAALTRFIEDMVREYGWIKPQDEDGDLFTGFDAATF